MEVDPPMSAAAFPPDQLLAEPVVEPHQQQPPKSSSPHHPKQHQLPQHEEKKKKKQQHQQHQQHQQQQSRKRFRPNNGQDAPPEPVIEYEIRDGLRHVKPYVYSFYARAKGRWWGRSILEVFQKVRILHETRGFRLSISCPFSHMWGFHCPLLPLLPSHVIFSLPSLPPFLRSFERTILSITPAASRLVP